MNPRNEKYYAWREKQDIVDYAISYWPTKSGFIVSPAWHDKGDDIISVDILAQVIGSDRAKRFAFFGSGDSLRKLAHDILKGLRKKPVR